MRETQLRLWESGISESNLCPLRAQLEEQYRPLLSERPELAERVSYPDDGIADPIDSTADPIDGIANSIDRIGNPDGVCKGVVPA
jgi:hypothetical protein